MLTAHDLDAFGKQVSRNYIQDKVPMTDSLTKIAREKGLNRQQMNRVAESANVEAYLTLIKTSEDKYINYDLADAAVAHSTVTGLNKEASFIDDYESGVPAMLAYATEELEKTAETAETEEVINENELRKEAQKLEGTLKFLENAFFEAKADFETCRGNVQYFTKQAILGGTPFNDTIKVLEKAAPTIAKPIVALHKKALAERMPRIDFDLEVTPTNLVNLQSDLYKSAERMVLAACRAGQLDAALTLYQKKYAAVIEKGNMSEMFKRAGIVTKTLNELFQLALRHKIVAGVAIGAPFVYSAGRKRGKYEQGMVLQEAMIKVGPQRNVRKVFR